MSFSVLTIVRNRTAHLENLIEGVRRSARKPDEIVIIDMSDEPIDLDHDPLVRTQRLVCEGLPAMPWGCVMADLNWRELGFEPGPQNYLLMQAGRYAAGAHRAKDDVLSLIELLDHVCADGATIMAKVLAAIDAPAWRFEATWASYHQRDLLRDRRYRWRSEGRSGVWHKHIRADQYQSEWEWHLSVIGHEPSVIPLLATERYRHDRSWKPVERKAKITA